METWVYRFMDNHKMQVFFMKRLLTMFLSFFMLIHANNAIAKEKKNVPLKAFKSFEELLIVAPSKVKNVVIFSSRDYITPMLFSKKIKPETVYWVLPVETIKKEDVDMFVEHLKKYFKIKNVSTTAEGLSLNVEGLELFILLKENINMVDSDIDFVVIDVDYFFRTYKNDVKTPKMEMIISLFQSFNDYEWNVKAFYLVKSLDINLPHWVLEFSFAFERIFKNWQKNIFPKEFQALDYVDQALFYFAQYEDAYNLLKEIENFHKDNPYFYERLFWASIKNYKDDDVLYAFNKAYELDSRMIDLCIEGSQYMLEKGDFYPAYVLVSEALKKEPWNKKLRERLKEIVDLAYEYYNSHEGHEDLFQFFKKEKEMMDKKR